MWTRLEYLHALYVLQRFTLYSFLTTFPAFLVRCSFFCTIFCISLLLYVFFFFFQAEDGIRDHCVTGVQTLCSSDQIGRASCRERVKIWVVAVSLKKKRKKKTQWT